jgi:hypothetical protein
MDKQIYIAIAICITIILSAFFITENTSFKQCIKEYSTIYPSLVSDPDNPNVSFINACAGQ